jgi:endoglucanase
MQITIGGVTATFPDAAPGAPGVSPSPSSVAAVLAATPSFVQSVAALLAPPPPPPPPPATLAVRVLNGKLVDASGNPLHLRGVNASGLEGVAIQGWNPGDPFGGQTPNLAAVKSWGVNAIRFPLNTASINGATTYDYNGNARNPDPGANYLATLDKNLAAVTAAGMYGIVDFHWTAPLLTVPGQTAKVPFSPMGQGPAPDADTCIPAIVKLAALLKKYPNVIFDGYNEWMSNQYGEPTGTLDQWGYWLNGGPMTRFINYTGTGPADDTQPWQACGMQALLTAFRGTGATNVFLAGGINWANDDSGWLTHTPVDPLGQLACGIHLYPTYLAVFGTPAYNALPTATFANLQAIQAAGYPVIIGETGGHNVAGTLGEPFVQGVLDWATANGVSYFGWTWNVWGNNDNVLIKDATGTPTDGYGVVFKGHA